MGSHRVISAIRVFWASHTAIRALCVSLYDLVAVVSGWLLGYYLRFNFSVPEDFLHTGAWALRWVVPVFMLTFWRFGLYKGIWAFASLPDLMRILRAIFYGSIASIVIAMLVQSTPPIPRSVHVLFPVLLLMLMGGSRFAYRAWREHRRWGGLRASGTPVILLGAGAAGLNIAKELCRSPEWRLVGVLDDDISKHGSELIGFRILGGLEDLPLWAQHLKARHAIIAMPAAGAGVQKRAMSICISAGVKALVVPGLNEMIQPGGQFNLRELELEDLLGREPVHIDAGNVNAMLKDRVVLVSGAGGSIGSELCRQIARFSPAALIAFELNEFALYRLVEEFGVQFPSLQIVPVAGDVRDAAWLDEVFKQYAPSVVFHAAAYKHVPLMEEFNAWQAMRNNVLGSWRIAQAAVQHGVERFVLVSTDKAVNPTNVMGASKRLAEMMCLRTQAADVKTRFECVRFGNVLGSSGSVVPKFREQIVRGGPVTVTHPEVTRYFMSIPEAAQLILQAGAMGEGGEIFVLDMGKPVRIADLARDMIRLTGASENDIGIEYTGLRPGEKLFEELLADDETTRPTHHPKLRVAKARDVDEQVISEVIDWLRGGRIPPAAEVKLMLRRWVPEYTPTAQRPELSVIHGGTKAAG